VPGLNSLATAGFACGTYSTPPCPQPPWLPTNIGENATDHHRVDATRDATDATAPAAHYKRQRRALAITVPPFVSGPV